MLAVITIASNSRIFFTIFGYYLKAFLDAITRLIADFVGMAISVIHAYPPFLESV